MLYVRKVLLRSVAFMLNPQTTSSDILPLLQMDSFYIDFSDRDAAWNHITTKVAISAIFLVQFPQNSFHSTVSLVQFP